MNQATKDWVEAAAFLNLVKKELRLKEALKNKKPTPDETRRLFEDMQNLLSETKRLRVSLVLRKILRKQMEKELTKVSRDIRKKGASKEYFEKITEAAKWEIEKGF